MKSQIIFLISVKISREWQDTVYSFRITNNRQDKFRLNIIFLASFCNFREIRNSQGRRRCRASTLEMVHRSPNFLTSSVFSTVVLSLSDKLCNFARISRSYIRDIITCLTGLIFRNAIKSRGFVDALDDTETFCGDFISIRKRTLEFIPSYIISIKTLNANCTVDNQTCFLTFRIQIARV